MNGIQADVLSFDDCDLLHTRLNGAAFAGTEFINCNVKRTHFLRSKTDGVSFKYSNTEDAVFVESQGW